MGSYDTEAQCMSLKVIINDSFTVIVVCRHSFSTIFISNIVVFSIVVNVVIIFFKMS